MRLPLSHLSCIAGCLLLLALAGCRDLSAPNLTRDGPAFASAQTVTDVSVEVIEFTDFQACTGEPVHWVGTAHIVIHETSNRGAPPLEEEGAQHFVANIHLALAGEGVESGGSYRFRTSIHDMIQSPNPVEAFPTARNFRFHQGVFGPDGFLGSAVAVSRFVLNGTGDLVFEVESFEETCR